MNPRPPIKLLPVALIALAVLSPAAAQLAPDSNEPLDITAERFEGENDLETSTFIGNVRVVQGIAILTTDRLVLVRNSAGDVTTINAVGGVRYATGVEAITGKRAVYDGTSRTITISENVLVTQGDQVMAGDELVYWVDTRQVRFKSAPGGRVRGIFKTKPVVPQS